MTSEKERQLHSRSQQLNPTYLVLSSQLSCLFPKAALCSRNRNSTENLQQATKERGWQETITSSEVIHIKLCLLCLGEPRREREAKLFSTFLLPGPIMQKLQESRPRLIVKCYHILWFCGLSSFGSFQVLSRSFTSENILNYLALSSSIKTVLSYLALSGTLWHFQWLSATIQYYLELSDTI